MQVMALEVVMFAEMLTKQNESPLVRQVRKDFAEGYYDQTETQEGGGEEDLSAVKWQSPSDGADAMNDIEMFNQAMAQNAHMVIGDDDGGEWI